MNINGVSNSSALQAPTGPTTAVNQPSSIPPPPGGPAASARISGPAQLLSQLQELADKDPAAFKQVTQDLADQLHQAAKQGSDKAGAFENKLADRFAAAAQSGDLSAFQPPPRQGTAAGHAHGHHHGHGHEGQGQGQGDMASILANALQTVGAALGAEPPEPSANPATVAAAAASATPAG